MTRKRDELFILGKEQLGEEAYPLEPDRDERVEPVATPRRRIRVARLGAIRTLAPAALLVSVAILVATTLGGGGSDSPVERSRQAAAQPPIGLPAPRVAPVPVAPTPRSPGPRAGRSRWPHRPHQPARTSRSTPEVPLRAGGGEAPVVAAAPPSPAPVAPVVETPSEPPAPPAPSRPLASPRPEFGIER